MHADNLGKELSCKNKKCIRKVGEKKRRWNEKILFVKKDKNKQERQSNLRGNIRK